MTTESEYAPTIRKKLMKIAEYVTRLTFWIFMVSIIYGAGLFMWNHVIDPTMPLYVKLIVISLAIFLLGPPSAFLLDKEDL